MKKTYECRNTTCDNTVERYESTVSSVLGVFCSKKCKGEYQSPLMRGAANPNYRGVSTAMSEALKPLREQQAMIANIMKGMQMNPALQDAIKASQSMSELSKALGIPRTTLTRAVQATPEIDISHFSPARGRSLGADDLLVVGDRRRNGTVKKFILDNDLIPYSCSVCDNTGSWQGKELVLQLEHKNGNAFDNTLDNLEFLCPNCHSQTDTYVGKNSRKVHNEVLHE